MRDFNNLSDEKKEYFHQLLLTCANNFGGKFFFLQLLEEIREGFDFPAFDKVSDDVTIINPMFDTLFFANIENTKKILNYKK